MKNLFFTFVIILSCCFFCVNANAQYGSRRYGEVLTLSEQEYSNIVVQVFQRNRLSIDAPENQELKNNMMALLKKYGYYEMTIETMNDMAKRRVNEIVEQEAKQREKERQERQKKEQEEMLRKQAAKQSSAAVTKTKEKPEDNAKAQADAQNDVELVVSGNGATKDEAIKRALLNAIEQTYGTFVSSNTTILNDELIKDEIVTVSSGNVKSYEVVTENKTDKGYDVTLKAVVSIDKLVSFVNSKGGEAELAGATFAMNVKLDKFHADAEIKAMENLVKEIKGMHGLFDYDIIVSDPQETSLNSNQYKVKVSVKVIANENVVVLFNKLYNTLKSLSTNVTDNLWAHRLLIYRNNRELGKYVEWYRAENEIEYCKDMNKKSPYESLYFKSDVRKLRNYIKEIADYVKRCEKAFIVDDGLRTYSVNDKKFEVEFHYRSKECSEQMYFQEEGNSTLCSIPMDTGVVFKYTTELIYSLDEIEKIKRIIVNPMTTDVERESN